MRDLITRLEVATEGSRELDDLIALSLGWTYEARGKERHPWWRKPGAKDYERPMDWFHNRPPAFTSSLDAALALVPEGWFWCCDNNPETGGYARITDVPEIGQHMRDVSAHARTPALALCIAAIKARLALAENSESQLADTSQPESRS